MARQGSSEFINLTLTEFLMVIIFILITLLFYTFKKNTPVPDDMQLTPREVSQLAANATMLNKKLFHETTSANATKNQIFQLFDNMENALSSPQSQDILETTPLPEVWDTMIGMERKTADLKNQIKALAQAIEDLDDRKSIEDMVKEKVRLENKLKTLKKKQALYEPLHDEFGAETPQSLTGKVFDMKGQFVDLLTRSKRQGVGDPLCWPGADGEKEFLFSIAILESGRFKVTPIYPDHREQYLRDMGYTLPRKTLSLSVQQFKRHMQRFWTYGQKNHGCRFFVQIKDETTTKERWKYGLALVENYFYKKEIR